MPDLTDLVGDERLLATVDAHLSYCKTEKCTECAIRLFVIRRSLTVLGAAGRLRPRPEEQADA